MKTYKLQAVIRSSYTNCPPTYRVWVDNIMYAEREFWLNPDVNVIIELMFVDLKGGQHTVKLEKVRPNDNSYVWIEKLTVEVNEVPESRYVIAGKKSNTAIQIQEFFLPNK